MYQPAWSGWLGGLPAPACGCALGRLHHRPPTDTATPEGMAANGHAVTDLVALAAGECVRP